MNSKNYIGLLIVSCLLYSGCEWKQDLYKGYVVDGHLNQCPPGNPVKSDYPGETNYIELDTLICHHDSIEFKNLNDTPYGDIALKDTILFNDEISVNKIKLNKLNKEEKINLFNTKKPTNITKIDINGNPWKCINYKAGLCTNNDDEECRNTACSYYLRDYLYCLDYINYVDKKYNPITTTTKDDTDPQNTVQITTTDSIYGPDFFNTTKENFIIEFISNYAETFETLCSNNLSDNLDKFCHNKLSQSDLEYYCHNNLSQSDLEVYCLNKASLEDDEDSQNNDDIKNDIQKFSQDLNSLCCSKLSQSSLEDLHDKNLMELDIDNKISDYSIKFLCPSKYPNCVFQNKTISSYNNIRVGCITCDNNNIFCGTKCIDPNTNSKFCGAKGRCISYNPDSNDYAGEACKNNGKCNDGKCQCADTNDCTNGLFCIDGKCITCPEDHIICHNNCIDPNTSRKFCGAKGECNNIDSDSANYSGESCQGECIEGKCQACEGDICSDGYECINSKCKPCEGALCSNGYECKNSECKPCNGNICSNGYECKNFKCKPCEGDICSDGSQCINGKCQCADGKVLCNLMCIDPNTYKDNCGAKGSCSSDEADSENYAGEKCLDGNTCIDGECQCDNEAEERKHDAANCGSCGIVCEASEECVDGECQIRCDNNDDARKDDPLNCGTCGNVCKESEECVEGKCQMRCDDNDDARNDDPLNCGTCGTKCDKYEICVNKVCQLECTDGSPILQYSRKHCGSCGNKCPENAYCVGGQCKELTNCKKPCAINQILCPTDNPAELACTSFSDTNCGPCNYTCQNNVRPHMKSNKCSDANGACEAKCEDKFSVCYDGGMKICVDFKTNPYHCGNCGINCVNQGQYCDNGKCKRLDNKLVKLDDVNNCGISKINCSDHTNAKKATCDDGKCVITECQTGYHIIADSRGETICSLNTSSACGLGMKIVKEEGKAPEFPEIVNCDEIAGSELGTIKRAMCDMGNCSYICNDGFVPQDGKCQPIDEYCENSGSGEAG